MADNAEVPEDAKATADKLLALLGEMDAEALIATLNTVVAMKATLPGPKHYRLLLQTITMKLVVRLMREPE